MEMPFLKGDIMSINIVRGNIADIKTDAIVNSANPEVAVGRGVDSEIYQKAGFMKLFTARKEIGQMRPGECGYTEGYDLGSKYIIHTVAPVSADKKRDKLLEKCYKDSLKLAEKLGCESVAFPLLGAGNNRIPANESLEKAVDALKKTELDVTICIAEHITFSQDENILNAMSPAVEPVMPSVMPVMNNVDMNCSPSAAPEFSGIMPQQSFSMEHYESSSYHELTPRSSYRKLEDVFEQLSETFQECLFRMIDERGLKDPQVYNKANISRKLFSKIRSNREYQPSRKTVIQLAFGLGLNLDETKDLMAKAGFAFSPGSKWDAVIQYLIDIGMEDVYEVNCVLFEHDLELLFNS